MSLGGTSHTGTVTAWSTVGHAVNAIKEFVQRWGGGGCSGEQDARLLQGGLIQGDARDDKVLEGTTGVQSS